MLLVAAYMLLIRQGLLLGIAFFSITVHECSHAVCAYLVGFPPQEIELTPVGAVMYLSAEAVMPPVKRCCVILAGPASTLLLTWLAYRAGADSIIPLELSRTFFLSNLAILLLNLLPVLPLDGGRLLVALLECVVPHRIVMELMKGCGRVIGVGLIVANAVICWRQGGLNLSLAICGCFLIYCAANCVINGQMNEVMMLLERKERLERRGTTRGRIIVARHGTQISDVVCRLPKGAQAVIVLTDADQRITGFYTERTLLGCYLEHPGGECALLAEKNDQMMSLS